MDENEAKAQADGTGNGDDDDEEEDPDGEVNFGTIKSTFAHDKDAVDFSEINDLAVDNTEQEMFSNRYLQKGLSAVRSTASTAMKSAGATKGRSRLDSMDEDYDDEEEEEKDKKATPAEPLSLLERQQMYLMQEQQQQGVAGSKTALSLPSLSTTQGQSSVPSGPEDVKKLYPAFELNKVLKFSELFNTKRPKRIPHSRAKPGRHQLFAKRQRTEMDNPFHRSSANSRGLNPCSSDIPDTLEIRP